MNLQVTITESDLKRLVVEHIRQTTGQHLEEKDVHIETKSKQNYRSEWEAGAGFRATVNKEIR